MEKLNTYYAYENKTEGENDFTLVERKGYNPRRNWFDTRDEATKHFKLSKEIAFRKYKKIVDTMEKLKEDVGYFSYECSVFVHDDSGLETKVYLDIEVNGYYFNFNQ